MVAGGRGGCTPMQTHFTAIAHSIRATPIYLLLKNWIKTRRPTTVFNMCKQKRYGNVDSNNRAKVCFSLFELNNTRTVGHKVQLGGE